jgi:hypothetical protein
VRSELDVPTFATRRLHACHHARAPSGGRWELWARNVREFCLNVDFHVTFRDILHAVKLRHGTDGFTSPSDGFGRVRTRELWYQRPARYLYTTEAAKRRHLVSHGFLQANAIVHCTGPPPPRFNSLHFYCNCLV